MDNTQQAPPDRDRLKSPPPGPEHDLIEQIRELLDRERPDDALQLFNTLHPADQGDVLVGLPSDTREDLLEGMSPEGTADIFDHLTAEETAQVTERIEPPALADILDEASPEVAADVLHSIPSDQAEETLAEMEEAGDVIPLLEYPDDSAGGLMTPDYLVLAEDITTASALDSLRLKIGEAEPTTYVFVVDSGGRLVGRLSVVHLALARPSATVKDIVEADVLSVTAETDQEDCARLMHRYDLGQLAVVDAGGKLLGVILSDDLVEVVVEEATEDMYRMAGVGGETLFGPLLGSIRRRLPWLYLNLGTVSLAALVIGVFESTIARVVALAVFLPIVPGQGGMGGIQTLTLVVRGMALGEIPGRRGLGLVGRELLLGVVHGLLLGIGVGLIAYVWKGNAMLGVVLGLAMVGNMLVAGLAGAGVPLLLRSLRMDPAVSSAVFITTFTDVIGLLLFLGLATLLISHLTP